MSTDYPGALDSYADKVDGVDDVLAAHINNPQDAIEAIEAELGTDPAGTFATVKLRLEQAYGSFYGIHIGWSQATATANNWYNIVDGNIGDGMLYKVTHDGNGKLTATVAGVFLINYNITYESSSANDHLEVGIELNGSGTALDSGQSHSENKFANEEEALAGTLIFPLAADDTLELTIRTTDGGSNISVQDVDLTIFQVQGL